MTSSGGQAGTVTTTTRRRVPPVPPAWRVSLLALALAALGLSACGDAGQQTAAASPTRSAHGGQTPAATAAGKASEGAGQSAASATRGARVAFVNVGQGDAILIRSGAAEVLIDGGPEGSAPRVAAVLRRLGAHELDTVVVTHQHDDHTGATDELVRQYGPRRLLLAGPPEPALKGAAQAAGTRLVQARSGDTYRWGAIKVRVMSPASLSGETNEDSLVLLLEVAGRRLLLTGDLTGPNEDRVAAMCAPLAPIFLLKVAHHGSRYSTSSSFLAMTEPRTAVISVGDNPWGHPTPATLNRLRSAGSRVYTTRRNGTITVTVKPSGSVSWKFGKSTQPIPGT
jgi:competence protein ComEC